MKISDIILEKQLGEAIPLIPLAGAGFRAAAAIARGAKSASTAAKTARTAKSAKTAAKAKPKPSKANQSDWWESKYAAIKGKEAALAQNAMKVSVLKDQADKVVNFLTVALIAKESYVYWDESSKLDALLASGQISQQDYDSRLSYLRGMLLTTIIAPKVGQLAANQLSWLGPRLIPWMMKITGNPNAAMATRYLSSKAVQAGLIAWFGAGEGKQWLTNTFGSMITSVGDIPVLAGKVWEALKAIAQTATGNTPQGFEKSQKPGDQQSTDNPWGANQPWGSGQKRIFKDPFAGERNVGLL